MKDQIWLIRRPARFRLLWAGDVMIWDSLAILEYMAEQHPEKALWPSNIEARALARSVSAEMHSGFSGAARALPDGDPGCWSPRTSSSIRCRSTSGGSSKSGRSAAPAAAGRSFFRHFTIADAMYAPVASRFKTYILTSRRSMTTARQPPIDADVRAPRAWPNGPTVRQEYVAASAIRLRLS